MRYFPSLERIVAFKSASDVAVVKSTSASATASRSARISWARLIAAPLCARMFAASRSRNTICRLNRTTVTFVHASSCTGGRPGFREPAAGRRVGAKMSGVDLDVLLLRRRAIPVLPNPRGRNISRISSVPNYWFRITVEPDAIQHCQRSLVQALPYCWGNNLNRSTPNVSTGGDSMEIQYEGMSGSRYTAWPRASPENRPARSAPQRRGGRKRSSTSPESRRKASAARERGAC